MSEQPSRSEAATHILHALARDHQSVRTALFWVGELDQEGVSAQVQAILTEAEARRVKLGTNVL